MTWTVSASGTQTSVIGTEQTLTTDTTNGTYYYEVDFSALANGDILELRVYVITLLGGTSRLAWKSTYGPVQPVHDIAASPPQPSDRQISITLKQVSGAPRSYSWKLLRI